MLSAFLVIDILLAVFFYVAFFYPAEEAVIDFDLTVMQWVRFFIILGIVQFFMLLRGIGKSIKATRSALQPLSELVETAQSINRRTSSPESISQLRDIAVRLDAIDASGLDTRIPVGATQKELGGLAEAINGMLDRINESYNSQVRFVSNASHELRTPISVIQGYANLLDRWGKNDEKALEESIAAIKSEAQSMKDLVEQLLFLARGDNDSMRISIEKLNINAIIEEVTAETQMITPSHTITFTADEELHIAGDALLIKQALRILIDNSIKYTPENEEIKIALKKEGDMVNISVTDSGIGINSDDLPFIFDRLYRSDDSRTRKTGGSGLGLSIAKWIVQRHGGTIEVVSRKDIGTRVTLEFDGRAAPDNI